MTSNFILKSVREKFKRFFTRGDAAHGFLQATDMEWGGSFYITISVQPQWALGQGLIDCSFSGFSNVVKTLILVERDKPTWYFQILHWRRFGFANGLDGGAG